MTTELIASQGTVQGSKEALVKDLRSVVGDADKLLKAVASSTVDEFATARTKVEARLGEARSKIDEARRAAAHRARVAADVTQGYVRENPWKLIGVAAAVGVVAALLLSRCPSNGDEG